MDLLRINLTMEAARPKVGTSLARCWFVTILFLNFTSPMFGSVGFTDDDFKRRFEIGGEIYAQQCASCHDRDGRGQTLEYSDPLLGDLNVDSLAELISDTMPEHQPSDCVGDDALAVATYVHAEFYSAAAQFKRNRPRVQLSRRTVDQYRIAVADLIAHFNDGPAAEMTDRGLHAEYYAYRHRRGGQRLEKRRDLKIDFPQRVGGIPNFRADDQYEGVKPVENNNTGRGFSVYWKGGIIAPKTGTYEFVVETTNGFKLWINDEQIPLIDRWVKTGDQPLHRKKTFLLGGRAYRLGFDLFAYNEPEAAVSLRWKPPGESESVIPQTALIPETPDEVAIVDVPFPADDASFGYERGIAVSREWDTATTSAAVFVADWVAQRIWQLAQTKPTEQDRQERVIAFCEKLVQRAFVAELSEEELQFFVRQHFATQTPLKDQIRRVVILALKSPRFLYPQLQSRSRSLELSEKLAGVLWDSLPDRQLFDVACQNKLVKDEALQQQLKRMVAHPRTKAKVREFFNYWLKTGDAEAVTKDIAEFPGFDQQLVSSLSTSLNRYLDDVVWSERSDYRDLFLSDHLYVDETMAKFYGIEVEPNDELNDRQDDAQAFRRVPVDPQRRAGILTHPFLMAGLAYHTESSPIHRGVFIARNLLGRQLRQPPDDVEPLTEAFDPAMTTRQRVEHQTKDSACMVCHSVINPLGFSLENFDAVGRFRLQENDQAIDVSAVYETPDGERIELRGARELAVYLAHHPAAQKSFVRQLFRYFVKQPAQAYGQNCIDELHSQFVANEFHIQKLLVDIAKTVANHQEDERNNAKP